MANSGLSRTAVDGNRQTFTHSFWVKRSKVGAESCLFYSRINSNNHFLIRFTGSDQLELVNRVSGSNDYFVTTNRKFRDTSAWYNILVQVDTTQGTSGDRIKFYVNGVQETSFATQTIGSQSANMSTNYNTATLYFGQEYTSGSNFFEGYMSHVALVDGAVSAPTVFGEVDSTSGIWKFKQPSGVTWGNNGVHLKFENSGNLGLDSSGNSNTFTVNGNGRQAVDTPSNVYATMNPLNFGLVGTTSNAAASNGNLTVIGTGAAWKGMYGAFGVDTGKWYYETKMNGTPSGSLGYAMGWVDPGFNTDDDINSGTPSHKFYARQGTLFYANNNGTSGYFGDTSDGDIYMTAIDLDNNKIWFGVNGTWQNSGGSGSNTTTYSSTTLNPSYPDATGVVLDSGQNKAGVYAPCAFCYGTGASINFNFGNGYFGTTAITSAGSNGNGSLFEYDVPSGYYALNTKNINTYG